MAVTQSPVQAEITSAALDQDVRSQIVRAANEHFIHYGHGKTTVSDLARAIGLSKASIYKLLDSKQVIRKAICRQHLAIVSQNVLAAVDNSPSSVDESRTVFSKTPSDSLSLFFTDRKLHDLCAHAIRDRWSSPVDYERRVEALIRSVIKHGRQNGDFERKTPLEEVVRAIFRIMEPFMNAQLLQYRLDDDDMACADVVGIVLRSP